MNQNSLTTTPASGLNAVPEALARAVQPVSQELTRCGESVRGVRVGPSKPVAEFLDIEDVRLRIAPRTESSKTKTSQKRLRSKARDR